MHTSFDMSTTLPIPIPIPQPVTPAQASAEQPDSNHDYLAVIYGSSPPDPQDVQDRQAHESRLLAAQLLRERVIPTPAASSSTAQIAAGPLDPRRLTSQMLEDAQRIFEGDETSINTIKTFIEQNCHLSPDQYWVIENIGPKLSFEDAWDAFINNLISEMGHINHVDEFLKAVVTLLVNANIESGANIRFAKTATIQSLVAHSQHNETVKEISNILGEYYVKHTKVIIGDMLKVSPEFTNTKANIKYMFLLMVESFGIEHKSTQEYLNFFIEEICSGRDSHDDRFQFKLLRHFRTLEHLRIFARVIGRDDLRTKRVLEYYIQQTISIWYQCTQSRAFKGKVFPGFIIKEKVTPEFAINEIANSMQEAVTLQFGGGSRHYPIPELDNSPGINLMWSNLVLEYLTAAIAVANVDDSFRQQLSTLMMQHQ